MKRVWIIGATSADEGHTWSDFRLVDVPIGMEGQVTRIGDSSYVAVRTGTYRDREAVFYATAAHPFGPWTEQAAPALIQAGAPYEKDEIIAPQLTLDPATGLACLFYTGADYAIGWWIMLARQQ
ncbi:MAG: hypothetical protein OHK0039_13310 [Bacteroidia bacterium]